MSAPKSYEVTDIQISAAGRAIRLKWRPPDGCRHVKVVRREGDSPANHSDGLTVHCHLTEAFETGLRENVLYCYRVCVSDNGATWSEGVTAQARTGSEPSHANGVNGESLRSHLFEAHDFGEYLSLQWRWPEACNSFLVTWRRDGRYPIGPADPAAQGHTVAHVDYKYRGGFRIRSPVNDGPWHFALFPVEAESPVVAHGAPLTATLRERRCHTIWYDVPRPLLANLRGQYELHAWSETSVQGLPAMMLVATPGRVAPRAPDLTAPVVGASLNCDLVAGERRSIGRFTLGAVARPLTLRAVLRDPRPDLLLVPHAPAHLLFD